MKDCKQVQDLMAQAVYHELNKKEQADFNEHLTQCLSCNNDYNKLMDTLKMFSKRETPDPGEEYWETFDARLEEKIKASSSGSGDQNTFRQLWLNSRFQILKAAALITVGIMLGYVFFTSQPEEISSAFNSNHGKNMARMTASTNETEEYLENAKVFLLGIVNLDAESINKSSMNFSMHRDYSRSMIQRTAVLRDNLKGRENQRVIELLNELEMIFLQLANYEQNNDLEAVDLIRGGVEDQAILLKIDIEKLILNSKRESETNPVSERI